MVVVASTNRRWRALLPVALLMAGAGGCASKTPNVRLFDWERGVAVESLEQPSMAIYLWFYEWNMFGAETPDRNSHNEFGRFTHHIATDGREGELRGRDMVLKATAARDGAELQLTVTNRSDHDYTDVAGIIPCFNPGPLQSQNPHFTNRKTYFVSRHGLTRQENREIHFNAEFRKQIDALSENGVFPEFSRKWPTSPMDATAGLILRESDDGQWVAGIAWERFLSVQAHNPWECMHLGVRVGPLKQGESRTIRGRIYLFKGSRNDCLARYRKDFAG